MTDLERVNREIAKLQEKIQRRRERGQDWSDDDRWLVDLIMQRNAMLERGKGLMDVLADIGATFDALNAALAGMAGRPAPESEPRQIGA
jgi:hypothetical protein